MEREQLSVATLSTSYDSTTSYAVVNIYSIESSNDVVTTRYVSQDLWSFGSEGSTIPATAITAPTLTTSSATPSISTLHPTSPSGQSAPAPQYSTNSSGLSNGATAGIAISTAVVGGLLGLIAGLFVARCSKKRRSPPEYVTCADTDKEPANSPTTSDTPQLDQFLLDSKPSTIVASELRTLGRLIQKHVESYYHLQPLQLESSSLHQPLSDLGIERDSEPGIERLASLVLEPRTRLSAIKYAISKATFESTVIGGSTCVSLLPPVVSSFSSSIPRTENHIGGEECKLFTPRSACHSN